jgi:hypothetical protein
MSWSRHLPTCRAGPAGARSVGPCLIRSSARLSARSITAWQMSCLAPRNVVRVARSHPLRQRRRATVPRDCRPRRAWGPPRRWWPTQSARQRVSAPSRRRNSLTRTPPRLCRVTVVFRDDGSLLVEDLQADYDVVNAILDGIWTASASYDVSKRCYRRLTVANCTC